MTSYLLDTHILVWWLLGVERLNKAQQHVLNTLEHDRQAAGLCTVSLRELAVLIDRRKIDLGASTDNWLTMIEAHPLIMLFPLTARIATGSVHLGDDFHRDPVDQIIVATALTHDLTLLTADDRIRKWGKVRVV